MKTRSSSAARYAGRPRDEVTVIDGVRVNDLADRLLAVMERAAAAPHAAARPVPGRRSQHRQPLALPECGPPLDPAARSRSPTDRGYLVSLSLKVLALTDEALESVIEADPPDNPEVETEGENEG